MSIKSVTGVCFIVLAILVSQSQAGESSQVKYRGKTYDVFVADPASDKIQLYWKNSAGDLYYNFRSLKNSLQAKKRKLMFATNGGIYEVGNVPLGLYIEKGKRRVKLNRKRGRGNFYVQPNGVFYLSGSKAGITLAKSYHQLHKKIRKQGRRVDYANQSGPMLVINKRIHPVFRSRSDSLYIRNGVGVDGRGRVVFAISNQPVNFYTFARFFKQKMQCHNALYLDGNISRMYLPEKGRGSLGGNFAVIFAVTKKAK